MTLVSPPPAEDTPHGILAVPLPTDGSHAIVVAFPLSPSSSQASAVFVDDDGKFLGSVAPGTASMLRVPASARTIHAFSSVEVTANRGTWFVRDDISLRTNPEALVVYGGGRNMTRVDLSTREALEPKIGRLAWIEVDSARGTAWLDAHRARVDEVLERNLPPPAAIARVTRLR